MGTNLVAYAAVDLSTVLWIKMVVANDGEHILLPCWNFRFETLCLRKRYVRRCFVSTRIADSSSTNAVSFSSARLMKRSPSRRCASAIQIVRPLQSTVDRNRAGSRLLFLAEFLKSGIGAQRVPERIEPKKGRRKGKWVHRAVIG